MDYSPVIRAKGPVRATVFVTPPEAPLKGPSWNRKPHRAFLMSFSLGVLLYSLAVLLVVAYMGDIGVRCIFGNEVKEVIPAGYAWKGERPAQGDRVISIGVTPVATYSDYIKALRDLSHRVGQTVEVRWWDRVTGSFKSAPVRVRYRPAATYVWSVIWFLQEMVIFAI